MKMTGKEAAKIANDVAENIDNDDTRQRLRAAVAWWANECSEETIKRIHLETKLELIKIALKDIKLTE